MKLKSFVFKGNILYDYENHLTEITYPDKSTETFTYCPLGKRIAKDNSIFLYDDQDLIAEYDSEGTLNARYTFGPGIDNPISVRIGTQSYFYHLDGLGSVIAITNNSKLITQNYSYDAFGLPFPNSELRIPNSFLFTSREYEPKSNLYYYRARYYDPEVGRFMSTDPILRPQSCPTCPGANTFPIKGAGLLGYPGMTQGMLYDPQGLHPYVYVKNNSVNQIDPLGLGLPSARERCIEIAKEWGQQCLTDCLNIYVAGNLACIARCLPVCLVGGAIACGVCTLPCLGAARYAYEVCKQFCQITMAAAIRRCPPDECK